jgi:NAD(P)-dependent dehydrogenase (short-subunit alcohol dehydrogenase family)
MGYCAAKRILVSGGGTGLGEVMAVAYAQLGATSHEDARRPRANGIKNASRQAR